MSCLKSTSLKKNINTEETEVIARREKKNADYFHGKFVLIILKCKSP